MPLALMLGGCDRQTPGAAQPASTPTEQAAATSAATPPSGKIDIANRGAAIPDFTFTDPSGEKLRTLDLKGKPVLINLWATWCGPCVLEMPMLDTLAAKHKDALRVLTVSQDLDAAEKVTTFYAARKFVYLKPWLDPDNNLSFHYNTGVLPTTVLYDAKGREVWRIVGAYDWLGPRTDAMLAETIGAAGG
ncbi:TlpA disulfide reductase family protein [Novosphingobium sp. Chol11]|uniref:TlpA family protein disulfide reductase n=1 Tax=Novosphingobium sp. Chol11 TaxID=1385763 RepID=UPI0025D6932E|nr:TlpA disulfide reductase family protein [Novosphingobium sp. Chol11]